MAETKQKMLSVGEDAVAVDVVAVQLLTWNSRFSHTLGRTITFFGKWRGTSY